eukprot:1552338-Prymnesium_polylepis.1
MHSTHVALRDRVHNEREGVASSRGGDAWWAALPAGGARLVGARAASVAPARAQRAARPLAASATLVHGSASRHSPFGPAFGL